MRIDPPPSLAPAIGAIPEATAAAEPPLEPPGERDRSHGFLVTPNARGAVTPLSPSSGVLVLPKMTAPASSRRCTTTECCFGMILRKPRLPYDVGKPASSWMASLIRTGTP